MGAFADWKFDVSAIFTSDVGMSSQVDRVALSGLYICNDRKCLDLPPSLAWQLPTWKFFHLQMQVPVYKNLITIFMKKAPEVVADINFSHGLWLTILLEVHWTRSVQAIVNWPLADESELKKHSVFQEISQVVGLVVTEKWKSHSMKGFNNEGSRSGSSACLGTSESRWASKFVWTTLKPCHGWFDDSSPHWHQEDAYQIFSIPEESPHEGAEERWQLLKKRVVQHNIKALSDVIPTMGLPNVK